jgi:hypothetical protein
MPRVTRVVSGLGMLLAGVGVGAVVVAWAHPAPDRSVIENASKTALVTASVELRDSREPVAIQAKLTVSVETGVAPLAATSSSASSTAAPGTGSDAVSRAAPSPSAAAASPSATPTPTPSAGVGTYAAPVVRDVVSARPPAVGTRLRAGDWLGEVSGHPVFALPAQAPLYRDLSQGCAGPDVRAVQQVLAERGYFHGRADGLLRSSTVVALTSWFHHYGYPLPRVADAVTGLPLADVAQLPADSVTVSSRADVGSVVGADHPLLRVRAKGATLAGLADELQTEAFDRGAEVSVRVGSNAPITSEVLAIGPFREGETSKPAGHDISFAVPPELSAAVAGSDPIVVSEIHQVPKVPSVPLTAVRQDAAGGQYVLVLHGSTATRVPVSVVNQVNGYAILTADKAPPSGTQVVVSGA